MFTRWACDCPGPYRTRNLGIAFQSPTNATLAPQDSGPQKSMKWSKKCRFGAFKCTFEVFSDHLIDIWWPLSWGASWHCSDIEMHFLGFQDFGFCMGLGQLQRWAKNFGKSLIPAKFPPNSPQDVPAKSPVFDSFHQMFGPPAPDVLCGFFGILGREWFLRRP